MSSVAIDHQHTETLFDSEAQANRTVVFLRMRAVKDDGTVVYHRTSFEADKVDPHMQRVKVHMGAIGLRTLTNTQVNSMKSRIPQ